MADEVGGAPDATFEAEYLPLTTVRRVIARRLTEAWQAPVFQLTLSVDMTHVASVVARAREFEIGPRITVTDILAKTCAVALMRHRAINVQFTEQALRVFRTANIGIAVAAPRGLVVPVLHSAERLSLNDLARTRADLVTRARENRLQQSDVTGGTFTISNLGMFGVEQFIAVVNPPQAAILAVASTEDRPVVREGKVVVRPIATLTLTVDHRAVDGAEAAAFLQTVKHLLEGAEGVL